MNYTIFFAVLSVILVMMAIAAFKITGMEALTGAILLGAGVSLLRAVAPGLFTD